MIESELVDLMLPEHLLKSEMKNTAQIKNMWVMTDRQLCDIEMVFFYYIPPLFFFYFYFSL